MFHDHFSVLFRHFFVPLGKKGRVHSQKSVLLLLFGVYGSFIYTFCSSGPVGLLLSILLCSSKVDGIIVFHISHFTSCSLFWRSSSRAFRFYAWPWTWLLLKSGCVKGSWFSIRFVQEGCHGDTEPGNSSPLLLWVPLRGQAARSTGREGWAGRGPGNLRKCFSTFALDSLLVFTWTISALMISCFQVCIHLKGLIFYKNCMGVTLVSGSIASVISEHSIECMRTQGKE